MSYGSRITDPSTGRKPSVTPIWSASCPKARACGSETEIALPSQLFPVLLEHFKRSEEPPSIPLGKGGRKKSAATLDVKCSNGIYGLGGADCPLDARTTASRKDARSVSSRSRSIMLCSMAAARSASPIEK